MKYFSWLLTLLLTAPCFAYEHNGWIYPDPIDRVWAGIKLLGLLLCFAGIFAAACAVAVGIATGVQKLFERLGGNPKHFEQASGILLALYALGKRSSNGRKRV